MSVYIVCRYLIEQGYFNKFTWKVKQSDSNVHVGIIYLTKQKWKVSPAAPTLDISEMFSFKRGMNDCPVTTKMDIRVVIVRQKRNMIPLKLLIK